MCCSGSTRNGQIVSGGASMTTSRTSSAMGCSFVSSVSFPLGGLGAGAAPVEPSRPVVVEEVAELPHLVLAGPVQAPGPVSSLAHESRLLQPAAGLGDPGPG